MEIDITFISDTHGKHDEVTKHLPGGDFLIHSGDICSRGYQYEVRNFLEWFNSLPYNHKIFIAGNHDWFFEKSKTEVQKLLSEFPDIIYLENSEVIVKGIKFWGSPYTPRFFDWAFNVDRGSEIAKHWSLIPEDIDILITHGPPEGFGDLVLNSYSHGKRVGCTDLTQKVLEIKPKVHVFGHIHSGSGIYKNEYTTFINASVLDEDYRYSQLPVVFKYEK